MRSAAGLALTALLLAGCGGSARHAATTTRRPTETDRLQLYLAAMAPHERRFDALSERVVGAVAKLDVARPGASWRRASLRLGAVATGFDSLALDISKVKAPPALADVHARLADSTTAFGDFVFNLQRALASELPAAVVAAATVDTTPIKRTRAEWARAVKRYAARLGVLPPEWLVPSPAG